MDFLTHGFPKSEPQSLSQQRKSYFVLWNYTQKYPDLTENPSHTQKGLPCPRFSVGPASQLCPPPHSAASVPLPQSHPQHKLHPTYLHEGGSGHRTHAHHGLSRLASPVNLKNSRKESFHTGRGSPLLSFLRFPVNNSEAGLNQLCIKSAVL